ncbi:hypothetical protein A3SI_06424 [Nitritalea halalkaliphila LW7]|uniref:Uncharacterized protein n=1 Tax=Nitritalea halalkaliphila LW7 TaxID=1189621 RepID=I5C6W8_9BACT|nr:hypothetical protein [Nitritalea halalkaliphila]EIM77570.1 hypothetical protein A3SI_06424 [Nitritalea halalkaliphila LW7]
MDLEVWKADRDGCKGERSAFVETIRPIKNDFLASDNQALIKTFGRPDRVELVDRSQNFFIYYLEPSPRCEGSEAEEEQVLKLIFRLNAYSRVSEVIITRLNPGD